MTGNYAKLNTNLLQTCSKLTVSCRAVNPMLSGNWMGLSQSWRRTDAGLSWTNARLIGPMQAYTEYIWNIYENNMWGCSRTVVGQCRTVLGQTPSRFWTDRIHASTYPQQCQSKHCTMTLKLSAHRTLTGTIWNCMEHNGTNGKYWELTETDRDKRNKSTNK